MKRYGTIGLHSSGMSIAFATALMLGMQHAKRTPRPEPTPEQIAAADTRSERERWNDEVDRKKAARKARA